MNRLFDRYDAPALTRLFEEVGVLEALRGKGFDRFDVVIEDAGPVLPHVLPTGTEGRAVAICSSMPACGASSSASSPVRVGTRRSAAARAPARALGARGGPDCGIRARATAVAPAEPSRSRRAAAGVPRRVAHRRRPRHRRHRQPAEVLPRRRHLPPLAAVSLPRRPRAGPLRGAAARSRCDYPSETPASRWRVGACATSAIEWCAGTRAIRSFRFPRDSLRTSILFDMRPMLPRRGKRVPSVSMPAPLPARVRNATRSALENWCARAAYQVGVLSGDRADACWTL